MSVIEDPAHRMKKESLRYAALVFSIMGFIGLLSGTGPIWARYTLLSSGILIFLSTYFTGKKGT
jgi:hypothetical protein